MCTKALLMRSKLKEYLAHIYSATIEPTLGKLIAEKLDN